ncbi:MAG TPA: lysoplasmalogenase [Caproiciproducens sp.]|nr:lysoplasmalogenase [Caproiciproducens sp.]
MSLYLYFISIAVIAVMTQRYFRHREYDKDCKKALVFKVLGTFISVLLCLYAIIGFHGSPLKWALFSGVFACMAADVVIELHFAAGVLIFLAAHLCFLVYYFMLAPFNGKSILIFAALFLCIAAIFWKYLPGMGNRTVPCTIYAVVLAFMFSVAAMLPFAVFNAGTVCIAAGAGLFVLSDSILADSLMGTATKRKDHLVMDLYYPAVYLLAVSVFYL